MDWVEDGVWSLGGVLGRGIAGDIFSRAESRVSASGVHACIWNLRLMLGLWKRLRM